MEAALVVLAAFALFLVLGILFIRAGRRGMADAEAFTQRAASAPGVVTAVNARRSGNGETRDLLFFPVVRFTTAGGEEVTAEVAVGGRPAPAKQDQAVTVLYDPADPSRPRLPGFAGSGRLTGVILLVLGIVFTVIGGCGVAIAAAVAVLVAS